MPFLRTQHDGLELDPDLLSSEIQHVLTLTPLGVTSIYILFTMSPLNHTPRSRE